MYCKYYVTYKNRLLWLIMFSFEDDIVTDAYAYSEIIWFWDQIKLLQQFKII